MTMTKNIINMASHHECQAVARDNNHSYRKLAVVIEDALSSVCDEIQQADQHQPLGKILSDIHRATTAPPIQTTEIQTQTHKRRRTIWSLFC